MPPRSWSHGTDHAAQYRIPRTNQFNRFCQKCDGWKLHKEGRKYYTCLTCNTRTEKDKLDSISNAKISNKEQ